MTIDDYHRGILVSTLAHATISILYNVDIFYWLSCLFVYIMIIIWRHYYDNRRGSRKSNKRG